MIKQATLQCVDHPYPVDDRYFEQILKDPSLSNVLLKASQLEISVPS